MNNNLTLSVTLTGDGRQLSGTLRNAQGEVREFGGTTEREGQRSERSLKNVGDTARAEGGKASQALRATGNEVTTVSNHLNNMQRMAAAALTTLVGFVGIRGISNEWAEIRRESELLERNLFRQQQLIETTGRAAERSAQQMRGQAREIALATLQSTEGVMQAQQTLMTFRNIRGEVFDEAIMGATDLAAAMGQDLNSTVLQLGRALEDPVAGLGALTRSGTVFTAAQRDVVREMVETNRTAEAQAFILDELAAQYGGVAQAEAQGLAGAQDTLGLAMQEARLAIGEYLRVGERLSDFYKNTATTIFQFNEALASGDLDGHIRLMTTTATVVGAAAGAYATYRAILVSATVAQWAFNAAVRANPLGIAITLLGAAAGALYTYRQEVTLAGSESYQTSLDVDGLTSSFHLLTAAQQENKRASLVADLIEMRVEAGRLGSELVDVSRKVRESGQLTPEGGALPIATPEDIQRGRELRQELGMLLSDIDEGTDLLGKYDQAMEGLGQTTRDTDTRTRALAETNATATKAADELTRATDAQGEAIETLRNRLVPNRRETVQLAQDQNTLNLAFAMGRIGVAEYLQMMGLLQQQYIEAQNDTDDLAAKTVDAAFTMEGAFDELRLNGLRRLDDGFADMWLGAVDGSRSASDTIKRVWDQTLAELLHMTITRPITVQLAASMGFGGGANAAAGAAPSGGFGINPGSINNAWQSIQGGFNGIQWGGAGGAQAYGGTGFANAATSGTGQTGFMGGSMQNFSGMQGLAGAGAGFAGNFAAGSVFGKSAEQQMGSTIGGLAGMYLGGPIGSAIGSFLGGGLGSLASHTPTAFDGEFVTRDSSVDMTGMSREERVNATRAQSGNRDWYYGGFNTQSEFGNVGFGAGTTRLHRADGGPMDDSDLHQRAEWGWELSEQAAQMDNFTASLAQSSDQIGVMRDAVQSLSLRSGDAAEIIQFALVDRSLAALDAAGIAVSDRFRNMGAEQFAQEMQQAVAAVNLLSSASGRLNIQFDAASNGMLSAADNIAQLVGGVENLANAQGQYYAAFFTEQERFDHLTQDLTQTFSAMGMHLPDTQRGVRELVEGLDAMSDAGQRQLATVYQNVPALEQYVQTMEEQRAAAGEASSATDAAAESMRSLADIARERETLEMQLLRAQGNTAEIRRRELAGIDESNHELQAHLWAINDIESAYRDFTRSLNAERQILQSAHRETTASIQNNIQTVRSAMQRAEQASQSLNSALQQTQSGSLYAREQGQAALRAMLEAGEISDQRDLDNALAAVAEPSEGLFATFLDYQRDQARTGHTIKDLEQLAGEQLTSEERSLQALENQLTQADRQFDQEMARLDNMLAAQDALIEAEYGQLGWLETVNSSVLSLHDALAALGAARNTGGSSSRIGQGGTGAGGSVTDDDISWTIDQVRDSAGGINDAAARKLYEAALNTGTPLSRVEEHIPGAIDWVERAGLPKFRDGGISDGSISGYLAELHDREAVVPLPNGRSIPVEMRGPALSPMGTQSSDNGMLRAMNTLIKRVESLETELASHKPFQRETADNTTKLAKEALRSRLKEGVEE